ncbi:hypothetical protein QCN27_18535 [Cereibacter sp. SYSU M97828]|nr:hypothetical protein [Cereibacter flavus]
MPHRFVGDPVRHRCKHRNQAKECQRQTDRHEQAWKNAVEAGTEMQILNVEEVGRSDRISDYWRASGMVDEQGFIEFSPCVLQRLAIMSFAGL